uniref:Apple domain-containing protein n=1 Tax=Trichobilharzia regenti TaxID=157069 RepID=A0AA85JUR3_TRIRE|nr:unnamed protein product [Trichobilharzia regenti]
MQLFNSMKLFVTLVQTLILLNYHLFQSIITTEGRFLTINDGNSRNFCQANQYCQERRTIDKKYCLLGLNYTEWIRGKSNMHHEVFFWTSIVRVLPEVITGLENTKLIWRDANYDSDATITTDNNAKMSKQVIVFELPSQKLMSVDLSMRYKYSIVCELVKDEMETVSTFKFKPFSTKFNIEFKNHNHKLDACYFQFRASDISDCIYRCAVTEACRVLYYSQSKHVCVHMLYVYALLPTVFSRRPVSWESFIKQNG